MCIAGILSILMILIGVLPFFLSSAWFLDKCVRQINRQVPGTLSLSACTVGWRQGLQCGRIIYDDVDQGIHAVLPSLKSNRGLLALLAAPTNLGTISLDHPVLTLSAAAGAAADQATPPYEGNTHEGHSSQTDKPVKGATAQNAISFREKITARLLVHKAVISIVPNRNSAEVFLRKGDIQASLRNGSVRVKMAFASDSEKGTITAAGFINLPAHGGAILDSLITEIKVHAADVRIDPLFSLLPNNEKFPVVRGRLSSELLVKATGIDTLQVSGTGMLDGLEVSGDFAGEHQAAALKRIDCAVALRNDTDGGWKLSELRLSSDSGMVELTGTFRDDLFMLNAAGRIDVAIFSERLPPLLAVRPDISLRSGDVDFMLDLHRDEGRWSGVVDAVLDNLGGMRRGQPFVWNNPIHFNFDGSLKDGNPEIRKIFVRSPFFNMWGQGDIRDVFLEADADFSRAFEEIGKIFLLDGWDADGQMHWSIASKEDGVDRYLVSTRMKIVDFSLSQWGKSVIPAHTLTARGSLETPAGIPVNRADGMELFFTLSSWLGSMHADCHSIYRQDGNLSALYQVWSELHLGRLTDLLHTLELLHRDTTITGIMSSRSSGYIEGSRLMAREFDGLIRDLLVHDRGRSFADHALRIYTKNTKKSMVDDNADKGKLPLEVADNSRTFFAHGAGCSMVDGSRHRLELRDLALTASTADLNIQRLAVANWYHLPAALSLQADGWADFSRLAPLLRQYGILIPEQILTGNGFFTVDLGKGR